MVEWHHRLNGHEFEQTLGDSEGQVCCSPWDLQRVRDDLLTEQQQRFNLKLIFNLPTIKNFILIPCWASQVAEL